MVEWKFEVRVEILIVRDLEDGVGFYLIYVLRYFCFINEYYFGLKIGFFFVFRFIYNDEVFICFFFLF